MKEKTKQMTSLVGTAITAACCLGLPAILSVLSAIGLGFLIHDAILIPLFTGFIGFNLWMLVRAVKKQQVCATETMTPFKLAAIGGVISILGLLLSVAGIGLATLLIYIGLGLFFVGNFRVYKEDSHTC
ncbi:MAG: MerC domain-containing protein [Methylococcaceae bacterium]|nr:MerC domain-containing protein [Methylococcaceae bacterium]